MSKVSSKYKLALNFIYNILGTGLPLVLLQIVILPLLADKLDGDSYGLVVTLISLMNLIPGVVGVALNNIRLLNDNEENKDDRGNYQKILFELCILNLIVINFITIYYVKTINIDVLLVSILSVLWLIREYYIVQFQAEFRYGKVLINNIILSLGYILGYFLFLWTGLWEMIYILAYSLSFTYIIFKGDYWKEKPCKSEKYSYLRKETYLLIVLTLLMRVTTYADKLLLYPILGGEIVTIYYAATVIGKLMSMAISPIASVLLSYVSKMTDRPYKMLNKVFLLITIVCIIGYFIILLISKFVLNILYSEYVDAALLLVPYTSLSAIIYVLISLFNPLILKFFQMKWQILINIINVVLFFVVSFISIKLGGIIGFSIGVVIINIIRLISMLILYYKGKTKGEK